MAKQKKHLSFFSFSSVFLTAPSLPTELHPDVVSSTGERAFRPAGPGPSRGRIHHRGLPPYPGAERFRSVGDLVTFLVRRVGLTVCQPSKQNICIRGCIVKLSSRVTDSAKMLFLFN